MALIVEIKVEPSSGRQKFILDKSGTIKCFLKSAPERGRANDELISILSKFLKVPVQDITIVVGAASRRKRIKINTEITYSDFLKKIGIESQMSIG